MDCTTQIQRDEDKVNTGFSGLFGEQCMESEAQLLLSLFRSFFKFYFPCVTSCPRGAVPVCRAWVGFLHRGDNEMIFLFVFLSTRMGWGKDVPNPSTLSMSAGLKAWHGMELQLRGHYQGMHAILQFH